MKKARLILSASLLTLGAFSTVTFTSCSKDDEVCATGYTGSDCKTEVRASYNGTYRGNGTDNQGGTYTNWGLQFSPVGTDATKMQLVVLDGNNASTVLLNITLTSNTSYTVESKTIGNLTYSGSGTIGSTNASLSLTQVTQGNPPTTIVFSFNNMIRQ